MKECCDLRVAPRRDIVRESRDGHGDGEHEGKN